MGSRDERGWGVGGRAWLGPSILGDSACVDDSGMNGVAEGSAGSATAGVEGGRVAEGITDGDGMNEAGAWSVVQQCGHPHCSLIE
jgi:hypothetical protein